MNKSNSHEDTLQQLVSEAREKKNKKRRSNSRDVTTYMTASKDKEAHTGEQPVSAKTMQAVSTVLFDCASEICFNALASPITQGWVDVFWRSHAAHEQSIVDRHLLLTYKAVGRLLQSSIGSEGSGSIIVDAWSAALGMPILGVTWHFVDESWMLQSIPISILSLGSAKKTASLLKAIIDTLLHENNIVGDDHIKVFSATTDNEEAICLAADLLTHYMGSVRCIAHTLALVVKDVFADGTTWSKYLQHLNSVTTYFNRRPAAGQLLAMKQMEEGHTADRIQRLKKISQ